MADTTSELHDFPTLLQLLSSYTSIPTTLKGLIDNSNHIVSLLINSISTNDTSKCVDPICKLPNPSKFLQNEDTHEENLFFKIEANNSLLKSARLLGVKLNLTASEFTSPTPEVYSQIVSLIWQLLIIDLQKRISKSSPGSVDAVLAQLLNKVVPGTLPNYETTQQVVDDLSARTDFQVTTPRLHVTENEESDGKTDVEMQNEKEKIERKLDEMQKRLERQDSKDLEAAILKLEDENQDLKNEISKTYDDLTKARFLLLQKMSETRLKMAEVERALRNKTVVEREILQKKKLREAKVERKKELAHNISQKIQTTYFEVSELEFEISRLKLLEKDKRNELNKTMRKNKISTILIEEKESDKTQMEILINKLIEKERKEKQEKNELKIKTEQLKNEKKKIEIDKMMTVAEREQNELESEKKLEKMENLNNSIGRVERGIVHEEMEHDRAKERLEQAEELNKLREAEGDFMKDQLLRKKERARRENEVDSKKVAKKRKEAHLKKLKVMQMDEKVEDKLLEKRVVKAEKEKCDEVLEVIDEREQQQQEEILASKQRKKNLFQKKQIERMFQIKQRFIEMGMVDVCEEEQ
ncbi:polyamine-modulated factor 1-binding protein, putative [Entamoeba invadens IP1]|uniref:Polyamine-modulated factor 1-binding protein, putative n=1 Tax=Entamoeba invadens IP1 TaxID=370355 RepID=A0A0A1UBB5_ENTIV|nr:polyamine-modulated factor 1-binding protein, putative [Entamoeba invadens IP1]ELP92487.1 polyamine-modulated factor 1-binding protein, putative [Entamoeba invadens IP1]|eukprot:XP_004259258.1 polyamine-modulated factor 1-binding protein, putative [Entamoeba invadens IP1]